MNATALASARRRLAAGAVGLGMTLALTACSEAVLEVGDTSVEATGSSTSSPSASAAPSASADALVVDPALANARITVGSFSQQFPLGWSPMEGIDAAESGDAATVSGAALYSVLPAAGKDQSAWIADLKAGTSGVTGTDGNLTEFATIVRGDGRELFHLGQDYADNRAHLYGYVENDTLHLLRFGLDGTQETVEVINRSVATGVHVAPTTPETTP